MHKREVFDQYDAYQQLYNRYTSRSFFLCGLGASAIYLGQCSDFFPVTTGGLFALTFGFIDFLAAADVSSTQEHMITEAVEKMSAYEESEGRF